MLISDLCGTDDRLPSRVASPNHHLLGNEDFLRRDLDPQVASGNHHAIALSQDFLKTDRQIRGRSECLGSRRELEKEHKRRNKEDSTRYLKTRSSNSDFFLSRCF